MARFIGSDNYGGVKVNGGAYRYVMEKQKVGKKKYQVFPL